MIDSSDLGDVVDLIDQCVERRPGNPGQPLSFDQVFIKVGDRLHCDVAIESIRRAHGTDIIVTKQTISNDGGDVVQETYTTLAGRAGEMGEEGFRDGTA